MIIGPLHAVSDINYNFINFTSLNITWSAPFTLEGVDILGYNITITNTTDNMSYAYFVQGTHYNIESNGDTCTELTLTFSGYNGAGNGSVTYGNFYFPKGNSILPCFLY